MHVHVDRVAVQIDQIRAKRDKAEGPWEESGEEEMLAPGEWGRVVASVINRPVSIEPADELAPLAKFVLRQGNKAVAFGRCTQILD